MFKIKLYAILAAAGLAALAWIKFLLGQIDAEKRRADVAEAGLKRRANAEKRESEIDNEWSEAERAANENLDDIPDFLRKRRGMRDDAD